ncbi:MAG TPA: tetratricopeptide repeat protein [Actinomycetota bacterium]|nr:tetratricopeptide repeat protein [Actinomycetota bacterium]
MPEAPATFLFTDIQGSVRLWQRDPETMGAALARHEEVIGCAVEAAGGRVIRSKGEGDSIFAVFPDAPSAVVAALQAQIALHGEQWPGAIPLRVRMAVHSGRADHRDDDYYGVDVNHCARLRAAAHGGQVLLSEATAEVVSPHLPPRASLVDLGPHRLRDMPGPQRVFQLAHADLPAEFPPPVALDPHHHNLPAPPTALVGRERELRLLTDLLGQGDVRLVTLTGPGGIGKTRLALESARNLLGRFWDGVWFVDLSAVTEPERVLPAVAAAAGVRQSARATVRDTLATALADRTVLLVLDNFEQVVEAADDVAALLAAAPDVKVLATSREVLHLRGEKELPVEPLAVPGQQVRWAEELESVDSVRLFVERAKDARSNFQLTDENVPHVAGICRRLEGLPLAVELAAARIRNHEPAELGAMLERRLDLLTHGPRDLPQRQRTLRSTIAWSVELLDDDEKRAFVAMSAFRGGCTVEAARVVCGDQSGQILESLASKNLIRKEESYAEPRLSMLETVREFALELLDPQDDALERHADYYAGLAAEVRRGLRSADQAKWMRRADPDQENLRAALDWLNSQPGCEGKALAMTMHSADFWHFRGLLREGEQQMARAVERAKDPTPLRARALGNRGSFLAEMGQYEQARELALEALSIAEHTGATAEVAYAANLLGGLANMMGSFEESRDFYERALEARRSLDDEAGVAVCLHNLGLLASQLGDNLRAGLYYREAIALRQSVKDPRGVASSTNGLARVLMDTGRLEQAAELFEESLNIRREMKDAKGTATSMRGLSDALRRLGELDRARDLIHQALQIFREIGDLSGTANALQGLGNIEQIAGDHEAALVVYRQSLDQLQEIGHKSGVGNVLRGMGSAHLALGGMAEARRCFEECLEVRRGFDSDVDEVLMDLAQLDLLEGSVESARPRLSEALAFSRNRGTVLLPELLLTSAAAMRRQGDHRGAVCVLTAALALPERGLGLLKEKNAVRAQRELDELRAQLAPEEFEQTSASGATLSVDEVCALAAGRTSGRATGRP